MALRFKALVGIFIPFFAILLMSHNVGAVDLNYNLNDYTLVQNVNFPRTYCYYSFNTPSSTPGQCVLNTTNGTKFYGLTTDSFSYKKNDLVEFYLGVATPIKLNAFGNLGFYTLNYGTSVNDWRIINFEEVSGTTVSLPYGTVNLECTAAITSESGGYVCSGSDGSSYNGLNFSNLYRVTSIAMADGNGPIGVVGSAAYLPIGICNTINSGDDCRIRMFGIRRWSFSGTADNKEQKEATEEAANESESVSEDNSSDQKTSSLINVFGDFIGILTNFQATDCNITLPFPDFAGGDLTVNVCQDRGKLGNLLSVFTSLTFCVFYIPLALKLLSMIYNEIRSFTNG